METATVESRVPWWRSVRFQLALLAGLGVLTTVLASAVGLAGLAKVNGNVVTPDERVAKPLAAFADVRDGEGDSRVNAWAYVAAQTPDERAEAADAIKESDQMIDDGVAGYLEAHGSRTDARGRLMMDFVEKFEAWKTIRDTKVIPLADRGRGDEARAVIKGELTEADDAMAEPGDVLFEAELAASTENRERAARSYTHARLQSAIVVLAALLVAIGAAWFLTRRMLSRIRTALHGLGRLAEGDLSWRAETPRGGDELSGMVAATGRAVEGVRDVVQRVAQSVTTVNGSVARLSEGNVGMEDASAQAAEQAEGAGRDVEDVNANIQSVAAATQQMTSTIREIAGTASQAASVAEGALATTVRTDEQARRLGDSSEEIMSIVRVITKIAGQTHLLALNATIEAARAGEAGRGFAVVAGEVKSLADETAKATDDIVRRVEAIQGNTVEVVAAVSEIRTVIERICELQTTVAGAVEEQSATTEAISRSLDEAAESSSAIATRIANLTATIEDTTLAVCESRASTAELASVSEGLAEAVDGFRL